METLNRSYKCQLDRSSKKFICPGCGKKRFVRYINVDTKEYLRETVGRCDRENHCTYHYSPKQYFIDNNISNERFLFPCAKRMETGNSRKVNYLPLEIMKKSVMQHTRCGLFPYLKELFRDDLATWLCEKYFVGASKEGYTVFWQVDIKGNIRQAKAMPYLPNGHRCKETVLNQWIDKQTGELNQVTGAYQLGKKILQNNKANLQQCFFGEYLLSSPEYDNMPIAIVESEKTAIIASVFYPEFIWLATGGKNGCKWTEADVCKVLANRTVILFPDIGAFDAWKTKGLLLAAAAGCKVAVSNLLESHANNENNGLDLADFIIKQDKTKLATTDAHYPVIWDYKK